MNDDSSFNAFVKAKLEEDLVAPALRRSTSLWSLPWWRLAASVAILCCGLVGVLRYYGDDAQIDECGSVMVMDFLEACDGAVCLTSAAVSFDERLLAWQDAPYAELVAE